MRHTPKFITDICSIPKQPWFDIFNFIENNRFPSFRGAELQYYSMLSKIRPIKSPKRFDSTDSTQMWKKLENCWNKSFSQLLGFWFRKWLFFFSFLKFHVIKSRRSSHIWKPSKNYQKLKPLKLQWKLHTIPNFRALNSSQFLEL